jgi:hypothetical protein
LFIPTLLTIAGRSAHHFYTVFKLSVGCVFLLVLRLSFKSPSIVHLLHAVLLGGARKSVRGPGSDHHLWEQLTLLCVSLAISSCLMCLLRRKASLFFLRAWTRMQRFGRRALHSLTASLYLERLGHSTCCSAVYYVHIFASLFLLSLVAWTTRNHMALLSRGSLRSIFAHIFP